MAGQFLSAVAFLVLLLLHAPAAAQERPKVFLGASSKTLGYSPLWSAPNEDFSNNNDSMSNWFCFAVCP